jgi:hypothetical protein
VLRFEGWGERVVGSRPAPSTEHPVPNTPVPNPEHPTPVLHRRVPILQPSLLELVGVAGYVERGFRSRPLNGVVNRRTGLSVLLECLSVWNLSIYPLPPGAFTSLGGPVSPIRIGFATSPGLWSASPDRRPLSSRR